MAYVIMWDVPGMTQEQYETTFRDLFLSQPPPTGRLVHISGPTEDGWRVVDVWESEAAATAFSTSAQLQQPIQSLGIHERHTLTFWTAHDVTTLPT